MKQPTLAESNTVNLLYSIQRENQIKEIILLKINLIPLLYTEVQQ
jgi:hypothetical protein